MKKIIIILVALVCFCGCAHRIQTGEYMVIEKERYTVEDGISEYTVKTRMSNGSYKMGSFKFKAPSNTYDIGDKVYFAVEN